MDCSKLGCPVHYQLPELAQTHIHRVSDAIQPSHPLSSPFPLAFSLSKFRVFPTKSILRIRWPQYWSFSFSLRPSNEHSGLISFRMDLLISLQSKGLSQESSPTPLFKRINSCALSFLYSPTLTSIHNYWRKP